MKRYRGPFSFSAVLTWSYQGNDDSGFEIEEEDTSIAGTNFYTIAAPGAVGSDGNDSMTVGNLVPGDGYDFRIRVDHTDGSVSGYLQGSVNIPISDAPTLSVSTVLVGPTGYQHPELQVAWTGVVHGGGVYTEPGRTGCGKAAFPR